MKLVRAEFLPFACQRKTTELCAILPLHPPHLAAISRLNGPIAQLDRVPDYESGGRGFESSSVHHQIPNTQTAAIKLTAPIGTLFISNVSPYSDWSLAGLVFL